MSARETTPPLSDTELALILAFRSFGARPDDPGWSRISGPWRERLEMGRADTAGGISATEARSRLKADHAAYVMPEPGRVHVSWWVRALSKESPAVRRAVAAFAPVPVGPSLRRAIGDTDPGPNPSHPPHAEALGWAVALAGERLVGGPSRLEDDPPVVRAIAALDGRGHYRLFATLGLAKLAFAGEDQQARQKDLARIETLRPSLQTSRLELAALALDDLTSIRRLGGRNARNLAPRLGLSSIGRLLSVVEPHRARWTLQHLPYEAARLVRGRMSLEVPRLSPDEVLAWESTLLRATIVSLVSEGRIEPMDFADPAATPGGRR